MIGHTLGHFRVVAPLGEGGMGVVYRAEDIVLERQVALKVLRPDRAGDRSDRQRFLREARLAAALTHPNVATVFEAGAEGTTVYLAMELLSGENLAKLLARGGPLAPDRALHVARQIAAALACAHRAQLVHRDVKPSNVMVDGSDHAKLTDFGLARREQTVDRPDGPTSIPITMAGFVVGTPGYMSPEQSFGGPVDARTDVFAFGVMMFEMLAGRRLSRGQEPVWAVDPARELDTLRATIPAALVEVIARCIELEAAKRPRDGDEILARLGSNAEHAGAHASTRAAVPARAPSVIDETSREDRSRFVGRERDLARLEGALDEGARIVTILGTGGIGKSRLGRELVRRRRRTLAQHDRVQHIDLSTTCNRADLVERVASALHLPASSGQAVDAFEAQIGAALGTRSYDLVLLDGFEQLLPECAATLVRWSEAAPGTGLVVASQQLLRVPDEEVVELGPLLESEGVDLFVHRARRVRPDLPIDAADLAVIAQLCRQLDGNPHAIELAAARMGVMTPRALLQRLPDRLRLLAGGEHGARGLEEIVRWSWKLLAPPARDALEQLSVIGGSFDLDTAEAIVDLSEHVDAPATVDVLQALRESSLLRAIQIAGEPRFHHFETVRAFAAAELERRGHARHARDRHAHYFAHRATRWAQDCMARPDLASWRRLRLERDHVLAAARRALADRGGTIALGMRALTSLADAIGEDCADPAIEETLDHLLDRPESQRFDPDLLAAALVASGRLLRERNAAEALRRFDAALALASDPALRVRARAQRAYVLVFLGRTTDAEAESAGVVADARGLGSEHELVHALFVRASVSNQIADAATAEAAAHEAWQLAARRGDERAAGWAALAYGTAGSEAGRHEQARVAFEHAHAMAERTGQVRLLTRAVNNLAFMLIDAGDEEAAREALLRSVELARSGGVAMLQPVSLGNLGLLEHCYGDIARALDLVTHAADLFEKLGMSRHHAFALAIRAGALADLDRTEDARAASSRACEIGLGADETTRTVLELSAAHIELAEARAAGRAPSASEALESARRALERARDVIPEGRDAPIAARSALVRIVARVLARALDRTRALVTLGVAGRPIDQPTSSSPERLPTRADALIGRDVAIADVLQRLDHGARLVTLVGPGGIGKTRLAQEIAAHLAERHAQRIVPIGLGQARTSGDVVQCVAIALGASAIPSAESADVLALSIRSLGPALLVIDDAEPVVRHVAAVLPRWLAAAPELRALITSRERLLVRSEQVVEIGALDTADGARLFLERALHARPDLVVDDAALALAERIAARLEGSPLAIELAAARAQVLSLSAVLERLDDALRLLSSRHASGRHGSVRAVIEWSWSLLDDAERAVLGQLSAFRAGFVVDSMSGVVELPPGTDSYVLDVVQSLRNKSMLRAAGSDRAGNVRLRPYETIRLFAEEKLGENAGARALAFARHARFFAERAWEMARRARVGADAEPERWVYEEREDLMAVVDRALGGAGADLVDGARCLVALAAALHQRMCSDAVVERLDAFGPRLGELPRAWQVELLAAGAWVRAPGASESALEQGRLALAIARETGDAALHARAALGLSRAALYHGDPVLMLESATNALALAREADDPSLEEQARLALAQAAWRTARLDEGLAHVGRAIASAEARGARCALPELRAVQAILLSLRGDFNAAEHTYIAVLDALGDEPSRLVPLAWMNLGVVALMQGRLAIARERFDRAIEQLARRGMAQMLGVALGNLALVDHEEGAWASARARYDESCSLLASVGDRRFRAIFVSARAALAADLDDVDDTGGELARALAVDVGEEPLIALVELRRAHTDLARARASAGAEAAVLVASADARVAAVREACEGEAIASRSDMIRLALRLVERARSRS